MTISQLDKELKSIIDNYHVYGAECILHSLIRACKDERYLGADEIRHILETVIKREQEEDE